MVASKLKTKNLINKTNSYQSRVWQALHTQFVFLENTIFQLLVLTFATMRNKKQGGNGEGRGVIS